MDTWKLSGLCGFLRKLAPSTHLLRGLEAEWLFLSWCTVLSCILSCKRFPWDDESALPPPRTEPNGSPLQAGSKCRRNFGSFHIHARLTRHFCCGEGGSLFHHPVLDPNRFLSILLGTGLWFSSFYCISASSILSSRLTHTCSVPPPQFC